MEAIVALAGRRIDPPNAEIERFPARNIEKVELAIASQLKKHGARWLISSAAAGADLLGIKAAIKLGITSRIVLSPGVQEFSRTSVEDRGLYWRQEFERAISVLDPDNIICIPTELTTVDTFRAINERILDEAITLSASTSSNVVCFAAWDGQRRGKDDFSGHFVERAGVLGLPVVNIVTL